MESLAFAVGRRKFCLAAAFSPMAMLATRALGNEPTKGRAKAIIVLWLDGGPSQLETFDPHPGTEIGGPTGAIATNISGIYLADGLPKLAREMHSVSLIRSMTSKEGDHERGRYMLKTGYRMNPSVVHPALGSICAAEMPRGASEFPAYISILGKDPQSRGGYLGEKFDPFHIEDPAQPVPDLVSPVSIERRRERLADLDVIENALRRRNRSLADRTEHLAQVRRATRLMDSAEVRAFKIDEEPATLQDAYGHTPFGRGCLAARRLVQAGVRCIDVQLKGWDTHANNFKYHKELNAVLDPAFAALIGDLRSKGMLDSTLVLCMGEFGRSPKINGLAGRDHWNTGFSIALAGGGIPGGRVVGRTDDAGSPTVVDPVPVADLHATVLTALGVDPAKEHAATLGRPIKLCEGKPIKQLQG